MKENVLFFLISVLLLLTSSFFVIAESKNTPTPNHILIAEYTGAIGPAATEWVSSAIHTANQKQSELLLIQLDTPGGLLESARLIVREIFASSVPVVVYIAPAGARGASAGVFVAMAAHVTAMAPGTRIGAAHPVELGKQTEGDMRSKIENDTVAFLKTIAQERKRNVVWAEDAIRKSSSCTEQEALRLGVIDFVAKDVPHLLEQLNGRKVVTVSGERELHVKDSIQEKFPMDWRLRLLKILADPNIAYFLMMVGIYGILYEIINPGVVFPGVIGAICLVLGLYALQTLPVTTAGVALLILAILLFIIESQMTSGLVGLGGLVALALGSLMLIPNEFPYWQISRPLLWGAVFTTALFLFLTLSLILRVRKAKTVSGAEGMVGQRAIALANLNLQGQVSYGGEIWNAEAEEAIEKGEEVEIVAVENLTLKVRRKMK